MPTLLPTVAAADLRAPSREEVFTLSRGFVSAVAPPEGLTPVQGALIGAVAAAMTGHPAELGAPPIEPEEFAAALAARNLAFRTRIVQVMVLAALVLRPLPASVADRIARFSSELLVDEGMLEVARDLAEGHLGLAAVDFERNGYVAGWDAGATALHTSKALEAAWESVVDDTVLAARWHSLETLPSASLGRRVAEFYRARGFAYPGTAGSAPPLLAQHDWVHVLADYGTTVESELEVFAFIARANDDMRAFSLLAMVVSLFETGHLARGAGLFEASPGHLSEPGMAARVADAMRRGANCEGSVDFLGLDWFELAEESVEAARERFGVQPKAPDVRRAGSVGPWEPGGISTFQLRAGVELARRSGRPYDSFGASLAGPS